MRVARLAVAATAKHARQACGEQQGRGGLGGGDVVVAAEVDLIASFDGEIPLEGP